MLNKLFLAKYKKAFFNKYSIFLIKRVYHHIRHFSVSNESAKRKFDITGPDLNYFINQHHSKKNENLNKTNDDFYKVYLETYGCQMNVNDSEVVLSILSDNGYNQTTEIKEANLVLLNTCAIREKPELKIWNRLRQLKKFKSKNSIKFNIGILGCMAERLKEQLLTKDKLVDLVVGPDSYRDLPRLLSILNKSEEEEEGLINTQLSLDETYADVKPLRSIGKTTAFLSIMRGCNNMCSFCIVPFTRGRERSRPVTSIVNEIEFIRDSTIIKDITLLGQNVNSYADFSNYEKYEINNKYESIYANGFESVYKPKRQGAITFAELLDIVAKLDPEIRIRFTSPHPKDFSDKVLKIISKYPNICKQLHVPVQSGSTSVLERMKRGYTRNSYLNLIKKIKSTIPNVALSTDIIVGFCDETEEEHLETLSLMEEVEFDQAFIFKYSQREKTHAFRNYKDNIDLQIKSRRLDEINKIYRQILDKKNKSEINKIHLVLVEDEAKKSVDCFTGKTDTMKRVVFPKKSLFNTYVDYINNIKQDFGIVNVGDYVAVEIESATQGTLYGKNLGKTSLQSFFNLHSSCIRQII